MSIPQILPPGTILKSNGEGPYLVTKVYGPCQCPNFIDTLNMDRPPPSPEHYHVEMTHQGLNAKAGLSYLALRDGQILDVHRGPADIRIIGREAVAYVAEQLSLF